MLNKKLILLTLLLPFLIVANNPAHGAWPTGSVPTTNLDQSTDSPNAARADTKTMADKVNTMVSGRNSASGVAGLDASSQIMQNSVSVTSTAVELNILDGVTATASEMNVLDVSLDSVTNYNSGVRFYIHDEGTHATALNVNSLIGGTFESIGDTSSTITTNASAHNLWAAMNDIPNNAIAIIVKVNASVSGTTINTSWKMNMYARPGGSSQSLSARNEVLDLSFYTHSANNEINSETAELTIPLDTSNRFELALTKNGTTTNLIYLIGWIK